MNELNTIKTAIIEGMVNQIDILGINTAKDSLVENFRLCEIDFYKERSKFVSKMQQVMSYSYGTENLNITAPTLPIFSVSFNDKTEMLILVYKTAEEKIVSLVEMLCLEEKTRTNISSNNDSSKKENIIYDYVKSNEQDIYEKILAAWMHL